MTPVEISPLTRKLSAFVALTDAELATLGHDAAQVRLGLLLSQFRDVPALGRDHGKVARDLSLLLPDSPAESPLERAASTDTGAWRKLSSSGGCGSRTIFSVMSS
ncbi:MAG: hypothetical protein EP318_13055 [Rhodobacteraceae bacterium]|nr:MAG: hypothetical protein EP318_13055 [Paracoccaceae bacterium]